MQIGEDKFMKKNANIFLIISIICFFFMLVPYLLTATYANPSADDFSNLIGTMSQTGSSFLEKAIKQSVHIYVVWQGTYTGNFLTAFGGLIYYKSGVWGLHLEYMVNILIFFL